MPNKSIVLNLQQSFQWKEFIDSLREYGFFPLDKDIDFTEEKNIENMSKHGYGMIINNPIHSGPQRDPSLLYLEPYILLRPATEIQLEIIIKSSQKYKIPISFCSGKTGLSGGYSNFGILVDLTSLHSFSEPILINSTVETVRAEQGVKVSDLIKLIPYKTNNEFIFPIQPSSACKLPVRVGGIVSTDASGITSGKLGSARAWIENIRIMNPEGVIKTIGKRDPLFSKIIGGNGYYGVVLATTFKLYHPDRTAQRAIIFGSEINQAFDGLQAILKKEIFPLVSEFVASLEFLPGGFRALSSFSFDNNPIKWGILIKGKSNVVKQFIEIMESKSNCSVKMLEESEFEIFLQERTKFALLIQSEDKMEYLGFPGFEDILSEPKFLPKIIETINNILREHRFHPLIFNYGHINFRRGRGLLLHVRLPVPINFFYRENLSRLNSVCETIYEVIYTLNIDFGIHYKAEHSGGPFHIWLDSNFRDKLRKDIAKKQAFINPHLIIVDHLIREKYKLIPGKELPKLTELERKDLFVSSMQLYLT